MSRERLYAERCAVCGRGSPGMHTGPVPPLAEIVARGPVKLRDMDFTVPVCSFGCADEYRVAHPLQTEAVE